MVSPPAAAGFCVRTVLIVICQFVVHSLSQFIQNKCLVIVVGVLVSFSIAEQTLDADNEWMDDVEIVSQLLVNQSQNIDRNV